MRLWILIVLIALCAAPLIAQDTPPDAPASSVFFLAREDTDQDGQVTDIDNVRLYEVALDGTVLFVTAPEQHVLMFTAEFTDNDDAHVAWVAQGTGDSLWLEMLTTGKYGAEGIAVNSLSDYAFITELDVGKEGLRWTGLLRTGEVRTETQNHPLNLESRRVVTLEPNPPAPVVDVSGRTLLAQKSIGEIGTLVQDLAAESPLDALWLYETNTQTLTAIKTWVPIEPLLFATHPDGPRLAVFGREFDGSMSLYVIDFSAGVVAPTVTPILNGLIDPPYTAMQWTTDGTTLLLVGESGDFVVSNIGRIEAIYALEIATGAFTRLSPEGTLVDRSSITSR